jgi:hypothetical protein
MREAEGRFRLHLVAKNAIDGVVWMTDCSEPGLQSG